MPIVSTTAADSAQGYGMFKGRSTPLTTYTFPSGTSTWTAPAGVTNIVEATGYGADGTAPYWDPTATIGYSGVQELIIGTQNISLNWSTVYSEATAILSSANAGGTGTRSYSNANGFIIRFINVGTGLTTGPAYSSSSGTIRGTATLSAVGSATTSGAVTSYGVWLISCEAYDPGTTGTATTGFGKTFPGGTPSSPVAPTTTFTNVAVTPGTTYTIVNNGSLTIGYYV